MTLEFYFFQLGETVDQGRDRGAEALDQLLFLYILIFHDVVQQRSHDGLRVELPVGADFGYCDRMRDVRFSRHAHLAQVHFVGKTIRFLDLLEFGRGQVFGKFGVKLGDRRNAGAGEWRQGRINRGTCCFG